MAAMAPPLWYAVQQLWGSGILVNPPYTAAEAVAACAPLLIWRRIVGERGGSSLVVEGTTGAPDLWRSTPADQMLTECRRHFPHCDAYRVGASWRYLMNMRTAWWAVTAVTMSVRRRRIEHSPDASAERVRDTGAQRGYGLPPSHKLRAPSHLRAYHTAARSSGSHNPYPTPPPRSRAGHQWRHRAGNGRPHVLRLTPHRTPPPHADMALHPPYPAARLRPTPRRHTRNAPPHTAHRAGAALPRRETRACRASALAGFELFWLWAGMDRDSVGRTCGAMTHAGITSCDTPPPPTPPPVPASIPWPCGH